MTLAADHVIVMSGSLHFGTILKYCSGYLRKKNMGGEEQGDKIPLWGMLSHMLDFWKRCTYINAPRLIIDRTEPFVNPVSLTLPFFEMWIGSGGCDS